jgi:hypothetical protein
MSDNEEERRVKARHDVTQFYQRRKIMSRRELPWVDMTIEENPSPAREEESSEDDNVKDDTYMPSPQAPIVAKERALLVVVELQKFKRKKKKPLMWRKSLQPPMFTWEIQSLGSPWIPIGVQRSAIRAKQIWWGKRGRKIQGLLKKKLGLIIGFTQPSNRTFISQWTFLSTSQ